MLNNTPEQAGVKLAQTYSADYKQGSIFLDIAYNWRTKDMSKVPAIFVQREEVTYKTPTMGQAQTMVSGNNIQPRFAIATMPVTVTCVAAEPIAVVENLVEYVKQPILYFRNEIQSEFGIRRFQLTEIGKPKLLQEGKNNFSVDLTINTVFDEGWIVDKNLLKLKGINIELWDSIGDEVAVLDV